MAKDTFLDWLREKILQNPQEPPEDSWLEISDSLDLEESWNNIGEELEINTVWDRIDSQLGRFERLRKFENVNTGISVAAGFLLLFTLFWTVPPASTESVSTVLPIPADIELKEEKSSEQAGSSLFPGTAEIIEPKEHDENYPIYSENNNLNNGSYYLNKNNKSAPIHSQRTGMVPSEVVSIGEGSEFESKKKAILEKGTPVVAYMEIEAKNFSIPELMPLMVVSPPVFYRREFYPLAYAGVGTNLKMSWLVNNKTMQALDKNSLLTAAPDFQQDFFLLYGFRLKPRLLIQSDIYVKNVVGQEYNEYREGRFGKVEDRLEYQSIGLVASYLNGQISYGAYPTYSRILTGFYGGHLSKAQEITQWEKNSRREEFKQYHLGLVAGYEHDTFLEERLMITYGIRSRTDLFNIYSGVEKFSPSFKRTRAISLDFSISFKYVLKK